MAKTKPDVIVKVAGDSENSQCQSTENLRNILKSSLHQILENVTNEKFIAIYKACYKEFEKLDDLDKPSLSGSSVEARKYRAQFNDVIMRAISETVDDTMSNMDVKLKKLEELKQEQTDSMITWRPPGNVSEHIIPFECFCLMKEQKELQEKIEKEQETLTVLKTRLIQKRNKANDLHEVVLSLIDEIKNKVTNKINDEVLE